MPKSEKNTIDLGEYKSPAAKMITGRPFGKAVREKTDLDRLARENEQIVIILPGNLKSIGPSFFEELFKTLIRDYGKAGFYKKVAFQNLGDYDYTAALDEAIDRVLRKHTALD